MKSLKFSTRLFLSVLILFLTFVSGFIIFQYNREKTYRIELLDTMLQSINLRLDEYLEDKEFSDSVVNRFLDILWSEKFLPKMEKPRITIIDRTGDVIYDSSGKQLINNHLNRHEVMEAILKGNGYTISRRSETDKQEYFYSANYFDDEGYVIRSSLPYDVNLLNVLSADSRYLWAIAILSLILIFVFYQIINTTNIPIKRTFWYCGNIILF